LIAPVSPIFAACAVPRAALSRASGFVLWPIAQGDNLPARRRFQSIADMGRFSSPNDLTRLTKPALVAVFPTTTSALA
jgi:hypothetical protein